MIKPRHNQTCNPVPSDALSGRCVPSDALSGRCVPCYICEIFKTICVSAPLREINHPAIMQRLNFDYQPPKFVFAVLLQVKRLVIL
jgi:hypothetical protein